LSNYSVLKIYRLRHLSGAKAALQTTHGSAAVSKTSRSTSASLKALQAIHALRLILRTQPRSKNGFENTP
jgi:hypothetical protein